MSPLSLPEGPAWGHRPPRPSSWCGSLASSPPPLKAISVASSGARWGALWCSGQAASGGLKPAARRPGGGQPAAHSPHPWAGRSRPPSPPATGHAHGRAVAPWSCLQGSSRRPATPQPSVVGRGPGSAFRPEAAAASLHPLSVAPRWRQARSFSHCGSLDHGALPRYRRPRRRPPSYRQLSSERLCVRCFARVQPPCLLYLMSWPPAGQIN